MKSLKKKIKFKFTEIQLLYGLSALVVFVAIVMGGWFACQYFNFNGDKLQNNPIELIEKIEQDDSCIYPRVLDGVCVSSTEEINPKLVAVMIENHPDARPLSGLANASVVYEAPVEANYSRFLVIYPVGVEVKKAGPVRSARPYYLDWASEYGDVVYMHVGGSPEALNRIKTYNINDLNEFFRGWYFWRSSDRYAPHNTYTSSELWDKALEDYGEYYQNKEYQGWKFGNIESCEEITSTSTCVIEIKVSFLSPTYDALWKYNSSTKKYKRYQAGYSQLDQDGQEIFADTIVIQHVETQVIDEVGRKSMETVGFGDSVVFVGGKAIEAEWKKESRTERTQWFDKEGNEVVLQRGKIWIEVVNGGAEIDY